MTTSVTLHNVNEAQLTQSLLELQESASVVASQMRATNRAFYKHLAELYMWWRSATDVNGYLDAEYAKLGRKLKKKVNYGINFAPLFWLAWGNDNGLTDDKCRRWSIALNKLNAVYESEKQYHTDSVAKLENFIKSKGGVDGLVGSGSAQDSEDDVGEDDDDDTFDENGNATWNKPELPQFGVDEMLALLYDSARSFYSNSYAPSTINLSHTLPLTADSLGIVLVRKVGDSYQLIGASNDDSMAKPLAIQMYLRDFSVVPPSIRTLVELVSTQCLPLRLQPAYESLIDPASKKAGASRKAIRRVMYRHDRGEFVLSPIRSESGVVTVARPVHPMLANAAKDVLLSTRSRRAIERRLVSSGDFNLYAPAHRDLIPEYPLQHVASHAMRIQHRFAEREYVHLDFWPFYNGLPSSCGQLVALDRSATAPTWQATLTLAWFRKFALDFTGPWVQSHGVHIKRGHQYVMRLLFTESALHVEFVYRDGVFENDHEIAVDQSPVSGQRIQVCVLSKDFIVAMQAIADLGVVSQIDVTVNADVIGVNFSTSGAAYCLSIPTCSLDGERSKTAFAQYVPPPFVMDDFEEYNDQQEGDFDEARVI